jgi:hypothetical protein
MTTLESIEQEVALCRYEPVPCLETELHTSIIWPYITTEEDDLPDSSNICKNSLFHYQKVIFVCGQKRG